MDNNSYVKISEAKLYKAMEFAFNKFILPSVEKQGFKENVLAYRPTDQKETEWSRDNPTTGIIYLKNHPEVKEAWVLVKFERREPTYGKQRRAQQHLTIHTPQEFEEFFGVKPTRNFMSDTVVVVSWDMQEITNKNPYRDFDETAPNFFMYVNNLKVTVDKLVKRLYRINDLIESGNGTTGNLYKIPYTFTNI